MMKAILFDLDGVFYQGNQPIPGAADVARWVIEQKIPHLFLTNTSSRPRTALLEKLARMGIKTDIDHLLTPPVAAINWLKQHPPQHSISLFIPEPTREEFAEFPHSDDDQEKIDALIVGDLGEGWDFKTLNRAFRMLMQQPQPQLIALGMTRYWRAKDGLRLDVAPFVAALTQASDAQPIVVGKPAQAFYQTALDILQVEADQTVMIGDDIRGDIQGAQAAGLHAIQVMTGKYRQEDRELGIKADAWLESVCDLPDWWQLHS